MLDYAFEEFKCKRNKILLYFGEKKSSYLSTMFCKKLPKNK